MGRVKLAAASRSTGPVVLHLDRSVALDLLQTLTQALGPHSKNIAAVKKGAPKGKRLKATSPKGKSSKGKSSKKSSKGKSSKGKSSKKSR